MSYRITLATALIALVSGCSKWNTEVAPAGFAIVREHSIGKVVFQNNLPVSSALDFTIVEIDGKPVTHERIPPWVDIQRGALVSAGSHEFRALASPHARPPNHRPAEVMFTANVESTKVYHLIDQDGKPGLIQVKSGQK